MEEYLVDREAIEEMLAEQSLARCLEAASIMGGTVDAARKAFERFRVSPDFALMVDNEIRRMLDMHVAHVPDVLH